MSVSVQFPHELIDLRLDTYGWQSVLYIHPENAITR